MQDVSEKGSKMSVIFNRHLQKQNNMQNSHNRGAAMIIVVCVMAVVMILSLTLLMAAYQMLATVNDEGRDELYYQQAMSFSEVLKNRLEQKSLSGSSEDALVQHIDTFMENTAVDAPKKETLTADGSGMYGDITLVLDKSDLFQGDLVITISVSDGEKVMSSCICKYDVKDVAGKLTYTFSGYYNHWE